MVARLLLSGSLLLFALATGAPRAAGAPAVAPGLANTLEVVADLTLIDGACRDKVVDFGVLFRFADAKGVPILVMMPGGARRFEFEAALRARRASFSRDELCGEIAENYAEALPGSVTGRPGVESRR